MSDSKVPDGLIRDSNLVEMKADHCERRETSLPPSNVDGAYLDSVKPSTGGNCLNGKNTWDASTTKKTEVNGNEGGYK